jgi:hypothetical protein
MKLKLMIVLMMSKWTMQAIFHPEPSINRLAGNSYGEGMPFFGEECWKEGNCPVGQEHGPLGCVDPKIFPSYGKGENWQDYLEPEYAVDYQDKDFYKLLC